MAENDPNKVQVENRKMVRDMRSKAILNQDVAGRAAYMKKKNARARKARDMARLKIENNMNRSEIAEMKAQIEELTRLVKKQTTAKTTTKKTTRRKKSEDS